MSWVLGLTGGIAVGKTQVANYFAELGAHLIDADVIARDLVAPNTPGLNAITEHFGTQVLLDGQLDRAALRRIIFVDNSAKTWLEHLLHPLIQSAIEAEIRKPCPAAYCILVAPLLFENGLHKLANRTLVVDASEAQQLSRSAERDGSDVATLKAIIQAQMPRAQRLALADDCLDNSGPWPQTQQAIAHLHQHYLTLAHDYDAHHALNPLPQL